MLISLWNYDHHNDWSDQSKTYNGYKNCETDEFVYSEVIALLLPPPNHEAKHDFKNQRLETDENSGLVQGLDQWCDWIKMS